MTKPDGRMVQPHVRVQGIQGSRLIGHAPEHRLVVLPVAAQDLRYAQRLEAGLGELQPKVIVFPATYLHPCGSRRPVAKLRELTSAIASM